MNYTSIDEAWKPAFEYADVKCARRMQSPRPVQQVSLTAPRLAERAYAPSTVAPTDVPVYCASEDDTRRAVSVIDRTYRVYGIDAALDLLPRTMIDDIRDRWEGRGRSARGYIDSDPRYVSPVTGDDAYWQEHPHRRYKPSVVERFTDAPSSSNNMTVLNAVVYSVTAGLLALVLLDVMMKTFVRR